MQALSITLLPVVLAMATGSADPQQTPAKPGSLEDDKRALNGKFICHVPRTYVEFTFTYDTVTYLFQFSAGDRIERTVAGRAQFELVEKGKKRFIVFVLSPNTKVPVYEYRYRDGGLLLRDVQSPDAEWGLEFEGRKSRQSEPAGDKQPALETKLEPFRGRWSTSRESKVDGKMRRYDVVLEFKGSEMTFWTVEGGEKGNAFTLKVLAVESEDTASRLVLEHGTRKYTIYYELRGDKLMLVGLLPNRPFEGFSLSGEYSRIEKAK
jgi:hypothetical protein